MNIFDDYNKFIEDNHDLLTKLRKTQSVLLHSFNDVIKVLDFIYDEYLADSKVEPELEDIFDIGYTYFSNTILDVNTFYHEYFQDNIDILNYYSSLIAYSIYLDDFKYHLENNELLEDYRKEVIDEISDQIEEITLKKLPFSKNLIPEFERKIAAIVPDHDDFKPVDAVFMLIAEELNIF